LAAARGIALGASCRPIGKCSAWRDRVAAATGGGSARYQMLILMDGASAAEFVIRRDGVDQPTQTVNLAGNDIAGHDIDNALRRTGENHVAGQ
jgi:hypothetical protein